MANIKNLWGDYNVFKEGSHYHAAGGDKSYERYLKLKEKLGENIEDADFEELTDEERQNLHATVSEINKGLKADTTVTRGSGRTKAQLYEEGKSIDDLRVTATKAFNAYVNDTKKFFVIDGSKIELKNFVIGLMHVLVYKKIIVAKFPLRTLVSELKQLFGTRITSYQSYQREIAKVTAYGMPFYLLDEEFLSSNKRSDGLDVNEYRFTKKIYDRIMVVI